MAVNQNTKCYMFNSQSALDPDHKSFKTQWYCGAVLTYNVLLQVLLPLTTTFFKLTDQCPPCVGDPL